MITEDYCSFELSKLLKEKGFDEKCPSYYRVQDSKIDLLWNHFEGKLISNSELNQYFVSAPTHQMAMKWLREVYKLHIDIDPSEGDWSPCVIELEDWSSLADSEIEIQDTYEEAVEAALKYSLENLI